MASAVIQKSLILGVNRLCHRLLGLRISGSPKTRLSTHTSISVKAPSYLYQHGTIVNVIAIQKPAYCNYPRSLEYSQVECQAPVSDAVKYICPSKEGAEHAILDFNNPSFYIYNCPALLNRIHDISAPTSFPVSKAIDDPLPVQIPLSKEAKNILKIRRKKMNHHKYKKYKKRMVFKLRKQLHASRKKKEKKFRIVLNAKINKAEEFSAEDHVREMLDLARRGGYHINIFQKREAS